MDRLMGISGDYWSTFLNVDVDRTMYPADCYTPNTPEARPGRKGYLVNSVNDIIKIHKTNQSVTSKTDMQIPNVRKSDNHHTKRQKSLFFFV